MKEYAKLGLALFGIYLIFKCLNLIILSVISIFQIGLLSNITVPIITLLWIAIIVVFIKYREKIAGWMIKTDKLPQIPSDIDWITLSLRLTCISSGILFLPRVFFKLANLMLSLSYKFRSDDDAKMHLSGGFSIPHNVVLIAALAIIVIYLLCGAPHYVRWQSKKIKESLNSES